MSNVLPLDKRGNSLQVSSGQRSNSYHFVNAECQKLTQLTKTGFDALFVRLGFISSKRVEPNKTLFISTCFLISSI